MKNVLVIYDANILIDICKLALVDEVFRLPYEFRTVDVVWDELREVHQADYLPYIKSGQFVVSEIEEEEMMEVFSIRSKRLQLSIPDCSALVYAKNRKGILLTSDKNLRRTARQNAVEVRGHLWMFDELFAGHIMSGSLLIDKLAELRQKVNPRLGLPEEECERRMREWSEKFKKVL